MTQSEKSRSVKSIHGNAASRFMQLLPILSRFNISFSSVILFYFILLVSSSDLYQVSQYNIYCSSSFNSLRCSASMQSISKSKAKKPRPNFVVFISIIYDFDCNVSSIILYAMKNFVYRLMNVAQIILKRALNWCNLDKNVSDARKVFIFVIHLLYFMCDLLDIFTSKHQFLHLQHFTGAELVK
jgi:hypothetical protein